MLRGLTVLIVEDAEITRNFMKDLLAELQAETVVEAENGEEAISLLKKMYLNNQKVDLILCDINMPVMTGLEFVRIVKEDSNFNEIPIIMTTAEGETQIVLQAVSLGVNNYIIKPLKLQVLHQKIKDTLKL